MDKIVAEATPELEGLRLLAGHAEVPWTAEHFALWLQIRRSQGIVDDPYWPDILHSDLLARIATGGPAFEDAPPLRYSYPWVTLCDQGWDIAGTSTDPPIDSDAGTLTIAQLDWRIERRHKKGGKPAWAIRSGPWAALVEWEDGPFDVSGRWSPPPVAAFVIRLITPATRIDLRKALQQALG